MFETILNKVTDYLALFSVAAIALIIGSLIIETQLKQIQAQPDIESASSQSQPDTESASSKSQLKQIGIDTEIAESKETVSNIISISNFPVNDGFLSSPFGLRKDPIDGRKRMHAGIDIAANSGTEIYPMGSGKVIFAKYKPGYGNTIEIKHGHSVTTRYSHLKKILVSVDQQVTKVDQIGLVGNTGRSTGPHLHLEVTLADQNVDPQTFLAGQVAAKSEPLIESIDETRLANVSYQDYVENLDGLFGLQVQR